MSEVVEPDAAEPGRPAQRGECRVRVDGSMGETSGVVKTKRLSAQPRASGLALLVLLFAVALEGVHAFGWQGDAALEADGLGGEVVRPPVGVHWRVRRTLVVPLFRSRSSQRRPRSC
ncbi:hypothetical protein GCM10010495_79920 [Kitasatospora herbaricolor]|nr:hypothetical protein GCM10010495_79920 [Kitasatospora herbaricolor]